MTNTTKRSVIIDLPPSESTQRNNKAPAIIALSACIATGVAALLLWPKETPTSTSPVIANIQSNETTAPRLETPPTPTIEITAQPDSGPATLFQTEQLTSDETVSAANPPATTAALPAAITRAPKRSFEDFDAIYTIAQPLIQSSTNTQTSSRLDAVQLQLQQARKQQEPAATIELLEDRLVQQLTNFTYAEINQPINDTVNTVQKHDLDTYAAVQWIAFQQAYKRSAPLKQNEDYLEALNASLESQHALLEFEQAATKMLATMAQQAAEMGDIETAKTNYLNILLLASTNQQALQFLHKHAQPSGSMISGPNGITLSFLPSGQFQQGSPNNEFSRDMDETQHTVMLSRSIYISTTEITQEQWISVMGNMPEQFPEDGDNIGSNQPVHTVTWHEAVNFCKRLNRLNPDAHYRLPTEAEWEYACRAGTATPYNNQQEQLPPNEANTFNPSNPSNHDHAIEVGAYPPNAWGLYDMHGNVWEWTSDWKGAYPKQQCTDPTGLSDTEAGDINLRMKTLRGGSYYDEASMARSANRWESAPSIAADYIGFRIVRESTF